MINSQNPRVFFHKFCEPCPRLHRVYGNTKPTLASFFHLVYSPYDLLALAILTIRVLQFFMVRIYFEQNSESTGYKATPNA